MIASHPPKPTAFYCSICEEESTRICVSCTKDTCGNHLCEKCGACSDCCNCELTLTSEEIPTTARAARDAETHPMPDPDPAPEPEPIPPYPHEPSEAAAG